MASKSAHLVDWDAINRLLPCGRDAPAKSGRRKLFKEFDPNGNGILSLNEVSLGLSRDLRIPGVESVTPAIQRAFQAARDIAPPVIQAQSVVGHNDYVDQNEFRLLLVYLKHYIELWEHYSQIDTSGDKRIGPNEFATAVPLFKRWGIPDAQAWERDPRAAFQRIDTNKGGLILFDEFADYCLRNLMVDEEEERREALDILRQKQPNLYNKAVQAAGGEANLAATASRTDSKTVSGAARSAGNEQASDGQNLLSADAAGLAGLLGGIVSPEEDVHGYLQGTLLPILGPAIEKLLHHVHETGEMQRALKQLQEESREQSTQRGRSRVRDLTFETGDSRQAEDPLAETDLSQVGQTASEPINVDTEPVGFDPLIWLSEELRKHANGSTEHYRPAIEERISELRKKRDEEEEALAAAEQEAAEKEAGLEGLDDEA